MPWINFYYTHVMRRKVKRSEAWRREWRVWRVLVMCWRFAESDLWAMTRWFESWHGGEITGSWTERAKAREARASWARKVKNEQREAKLQFGGREWLDLHRISTPIKSPPRKFWKLYKEFYYEEFYKKFTSPHENLMKIPKSNKNSLYRFYKLPI